MVCMQGIFTCSPFPPPRGPANRQGVIVKSYADTLESSIYHIEYPLAPPKFTRSAEPRAGVAPQTNVAHHKHVNETIRSRHDGIDRTRRDC